MSQKTLFKRKVTRQELNTLVDKAADLIRTVVNYRFILVLLFFKRANDVRRNEKEQAKKRLVKEAGLSEKEANEMIDKSKDFYTFNISRQYLWDVMTRDVKNLPKDRGALQS